MSTGVGEGGGCSSGYDFNIFVHVSLRLELRSHDTKCSRNRVSSVARHAFNSLY